MIDLRLAHLRSFVAVADTLHFGRAADELGLAQSAVSQHISRVERDVGTPLLSRTSRSVTLTPAGAEFLAGARRSLLEVDRTIKRARAVADGELGTLVVGAQPAARVLLAPQAIATLALEVPDLRIELISVTSTEALARLLDGTIDVALVRDLAPRPGVELEQLATELVMVALCYEHQLARNASVELAELREEARIGWPRQGAPEFHDRMQMACDAADLETPPRYEIRGIEARLGLVAAGVGYALEPASYSLMGVEKVRFLSISSEPIAASLQVAWPSIYQAPGLPAFLDAARSVDFGRSRCCS